MNLNHVIESQQFTLPKIKELFERTELMKKIVARGGTKDYENKIMANLFYKPSTRTRFSFASAMYRLGGKVMTTEQAGEFSSEVEGEKLEDTIRIIAHYSDVIVLRHVEEGGAERAASVSTVPIINAGDGSGGQHPTQALLDLYTIYSECNTLDGMSVAFIGALDTGRTVRSLAYLLSKYDRTKLYFIAPDEMQIKPDILEYLDKRNVSYELANTTKGIVNRVDVIYQTRINQNRLKSKKIDLSVYNIDSDVLKVMKNDAIIMHPLPRSVEISHEVDSDHRAKYFRQSENGIYVRMALLTMLFDN
ncbi:MAG: aspartate carbamoyltransferase [Ignavibacteriae bacterium HGW-Ignavibacteriae-1]|jgi:aspartate carbamoyltransferase catalytic subunit|nr:MAG: aspartate carbamoyltransferase [Ignavibacteriae bacterium HGW-Ignavibacteriae-1]